MRQEPKKPWVTPAIKNMELSEELLKLFPEESFRPAEQDRTAEPKDRKHEADGQ